MNYYTLLQYKNATKNCSEINAIFNCSSTNNASLNCSK